MALVQCPECGASISSTTTSCPSCGFIGEPGSDNYRRHLAMRSGGPMAMALQEPRHGVPALLSFFIPGLGQLVKGHVLTGILVLFGSVVAAMLMYVAIGFVLLPALWIWQIYDAYTAA